ncbi:MAG: Spx/MgsR family RNA polymerase-binding regulatory protein [Bacilli bacterium]|jgi:regulatory protein spx|nr:Spx/MgsR family RNA polymerase-binding regulatory protein [Bacilli bacterium]
MLKLYTSPSCLSCRKVKKYFNKYNIPYVEKNILHNKLSRDEIFKMLANSENGFEDIISMRSKIIKEQNIDLDSMKIHELVDYIVANPTILKRPIIVTDYEIQVGYNDDDITLFLPPEIRERECQFCLGPNEDCDYVKALKIE